MLCPQGNPEVLTQNTVSRLQGSTLPKGSPLVVEEELNSELALTTGRNLVPIVWIMKRS